MTDRTSTRAHLTYAEAAEHLGISQRSVGRLVANGTLRVVHPVPGRTLFRLSDLDAYLDTVSRGGAPRRGRRS